MKSVNRQNIYCISGLGAGEKIFSNLQIEGFSLKHIPWIQPVRKEPIARYARRMAESVTEPQPVILGVSFGGMMAIEIAKQMPVRKMFIVSSVKSTSEVPLWMRASGYFHLNKIIPIKPFSLIESLSNNRLGVSSEEEKLMVRAYRHSVDPYYLKWAVDKVINWKNDWRPENLIHIHGDRDKIFPIKNIYAAHVIPNGSHMMIYNRAGEISELIKNSLQ